MEEKRKEASQPTMLLGAASGEVEPPPGIVPPPAYALVRLLGRGGMGEVWLARDRTLERLLALKFLTNARPADVVRFRREARYAARLDHRSIVRVYELGEVERQPYIAMQFVDGPNLGQASLERGELLRAVSTIARALEHAHAAGIVHRDLKPQNILLDREGNAYLSDFGLARDVKARDASLTDAGVVVGTPSLMPPEQARGASHAIDALDRPDGAASARGDRHEVPREGP
ncbi:serine/threonine protein kinase [bacterium]|nr:serine/threonine protein kinase [bacterium]